MSTPPESLRRPRNPGSFDIGSSPPSLKRSHVSEFHSPTLDQPAPKQAKFTSPARVAHEGHDALGSVQDGLQEGALDRGPPPAAVETAATVAPGPISLLEAAATMVSRQDESARHRVSVPTRGPAAGSIPVRTSPHISPRGSDQPGGFRTRATSDSSALQLLHTVALTEYLQLDDRPTLVLDLDDDANRTSTTLHILFVNNALQSRPALHDHISGRSEDPTLLLDLGTPFSDFKAWATSQVTEVDIVPSFPFAGYMWQSVVLKKRIRVIHGRHHPLSPAGPLESHRNTLHQYHGLSSGSASSSTATGRNESASPSYFDIPTRINTSIPSTLQRLVTDSVPGASPTSTEDDRMGETDDMEYSDLLTQSASPAENKTFPSKINIGVSDTEMIAPKPEQGFFDWTRLPLSPSLPEHVQFARSVDWAATSLGPIENWSPELRGMCNLIMASPHPSAMYWGRDHVAIYNESYILLAGQKHPSLMGSRYRDAWAEIWDALADVFDNAMDNAQATMKDDDCLFLWRNGFLEETYFSWSIIPLIGDDGAVVGLYNPAFEKTRRKVAERRMLTLREIGERTATARKVSEFWSLLLEGIDYNEYDAPMVLVYSLNDDLSDNDAASSNSSGTASSKVCQLEGTLGIPPGHVASPTTIDLKTSHEGFAAQFRQALTNDRPIVLRQEDGSLDVSLLDGIEWRGFGDPSNIVVIAPIHPTTGESTLGFLVMSTNPRRPYDEDYDLFVQLLGRQLATSIASVVLFEEEIKKGERAAKLAAQDRIELNNQLVARTQQAVEAENKFTRMAELAPVGIFIGNVEGKIGFVNDAWYSISSFPRDVEVQDEWFNFILDEDRPKVTQTWNRMLEKKCPISMEFRFKTPWRDKHGNKGYTWVLTSASPERDEDGYIHRIFGSVTDISSQKFAENMQTRRMEEAVELKRQQERYIDTTSHEMRNPLSAILQCADSITISLMEMRDAAETDSAYRENLESTIDAAQTITLCAQHQKRIVDDVLTLSKLDSAMMTITPVDAQPVAVAQRVLKMFEGELKTSEIDIQFHVDPSYTTMQVDWVRLDPHRLSQVLINLMTNAIKFTTMQENKTVCMHLAASREKPSQEDKWNLTFIPSRTAKDNDVTAGAEWGLGEAIYIHFAVQDTGKGLDDVEKTQLFQRFSQASPKTHVTYGGSGLGLFISREMVELQGGEIGVASEREKGSTFAFYVKARRCPLPAGRVEAQSILPGIQSGIQNERDSPSSQSPRNQQATAPTSSRTNTSLKTVNRPLISVQLYVLVVEDNVINQKVLAAQLRKIGCTVYVANHGGEAIDQIKMSKFHRSRVNDGIEIDIVLMDLEMPVMDGQTCARKLREMQNTGELVAHIPVIAVTANARAEQIEMTLKSGIDDVVSKPFRIPELVPKMNDVIARFSDQRSKS